MWFCKYFVVSIVNWEYALRHKLGEFEYDKNFG